MKGGPTLKISSDFVKAFSDSISALSLKEVLVGIPEDKTSRESQSTDVINNATILAINEFGSPINNIPSRHPMKTGIKKAQEPIANQFKLCAQNVLTQGAGAIDTYFERAGIIASNSVKQVINNQEDMDPPSEATLAARQAAGFKGTKSLIVTGQMRNAITYVVRGK